MKNSTALVGFVALVGIGVLVQPNGSEGPADPAPIRAPIAPSPYPAVSPTPVAYVPSNGRVHIHLESDGAGGLRARQVTRLPAGAMPLMRITSKDGYAEHGYMEGPFPLVEGSHGKTIIQTWKATRPDGTIISLGLNGLTAHPPEEK